jgi:hypothetical protein
VLNCGTLYVSLTLSVIFLFETFMFPASSKDQRWVARRSTSIGQRGCISMTSMVWCSPSYVSLEFLGVMLFQYPLTKYKKGVALFVRSGGTACTSANAGTKAEVDCALRFLELPVLMSVFWIFIHCLILCGSSRDLRASCGRESPTFYTISQESRVRILSCDLRTGIHIMSLLSRGRACLLWYGTVGE